MLISVSFYRTSFGRIHGWRVPAARLRLPADSPVFSNLVHELVYQHIDEQEMGAPTPYGLAYVFGGESYEGSATTLW